MVADVTEFAVPDVWDALVTHDPDRPALVFRDRSFTRAQLWDRSLRLGNVLVARGLGAHRDRAGLQPWESGQDHLALYLHNGNEYLEGMLGAFAARVAPCNVNYRYVADELRYVLADADARAIIYHSAFAPILAEVRDELPSLTEFFQVADPSGNDLLPGAVWYEDALAAASPEAPRSKSSPDDLYILYTGGTTGRPKGVLWRQGDAFPECFGGSRTGASMAEVVAHDKHRSRALITPPFMHGAGHWVALSCLHRGGTVFIPDIPNRMDPAEMWDTVERERITFLLIVGDAFARPLLDELASRRRDLACLSVILSGGAALSVGLKNAFLQHLPQLIIIDGMGSSEVGGQLQQVSTDGTVVTGEFPLQESAAVLSADFTRVLAPGDPEIGWLGKKGPRLALGYLGDPIRTHQTYPVVDGVRYGVPGDRARLRADNVVEVHGRESATINSGGEKIFAEEVEAAIKTHPAVYDCLVTGRPSERWGNEVVAVVRVRSGFVVDAAALREQAARSLARFKLPKAYVFVDDIARSPAGKADYRWAKALVTNDLAQLGLRQQD
jgi:3-oxocholest-4-en-26-oate---CoA ligase